MLLAEDVEAFKCLTNGHSKKSTTTLLWWHFNTTFSNFARIDSAVRMSPAMVCGLAQRLWDIGDIVKLIEEWEAKWLFSA